jgi:hypothetical protein
LSVARHRSICFIGLFSLYYVNNCHLIGVLPAIVAAVGVGIAQSLNEYA